MGFGSREVAFDQEGQRRKGGKGDRDRERERERERENSLTLDGRKHDERGERIQDESALSFSLFIRGVCFEWGFGSREVGRVSRPCNMAQ